MLSWAQINYAALDAWAGHQIFCKVSNEYKQKHIDAEYFTFYLPLARLTIIFFCFFVAVVFTSQRGASGTKRVVLRHGGHQTHRCD